MAGGSFADQTGGAGLDDKERELIGGGNAARLFAPAVEEGL
jgi:hypothetical protein